MSDSVMGDGDGAIPSPKKYVNPQMLARAMAGVMMADIDVTGSSRPIATDEQYRAIAERLIHNVIGPERISAVLATWAEDAESAVISIEATVEDRRVAIGMLPIGSVIAGARVVYLRVDNSHTNGWQQLSGGRELTRRYGNDVLAKNHLSYTVLREGWGE